MQKALQMVDNKMSDDRSAPVPDTGLVFYQTEDGKSRIQVQLQDGTVWLSQRLLAELYQVSVRTISEHIINIYSDHELIPQATIRKFRTVQTEGSRQVERLMDFYSLEMILAIGYRVRSHMGVQFRSWATERLREYLVKGFVLDYAEDQALRGKPVYMKDWQEKLNSFLQFNQRAILEHSGKISMKVARAKALEQYQAFSRLRIEEGDALAEKEFEEEVKKMTNGQEEGK